MIDPELPGVDEYLDVLTQALKKPAWKPEDLFKEPPEDEE